MRKLEVDYMTESQQREALTGLWGGHYQQLYEGRKSSTCQRSSPRGRDRSIKSSVQVAGGTIT